MNRYDGRTGSFRRFLPEAGNPASLSGRAVLSILEDRDGSLWVGTRSGLNRMDKAAGIFEWFVSDIKNPAGNGPSDNFIHCIHEDAAGILWLGTNNGLNRFDRRRGEWSYYPARDGLPGDVVCGVLEDGSGKLWIGTSRGLARSEPRTGAFTAFGIPDGIQGNAFNPGAFVKGADGKLRFGGANGYNALRPDGVKADPFVPPVVWTGFFRNSQRDAGRSPGFRNREIELEPVGLGV